MRRALAVGTIGLTSMLGGCNNNSVNIGFGNKIYNYPPVQAPVGRAINSGAGNRNDCNGVNPYAKALATGSIDPTLHGDRCVVDDERELVGGKRNQFFINEPVTFFLESAGMEGRRVNYRLVQDECNNLINEGSTTIKYNKFNLSVLGREFAPCELQPGHYTATWADETGREIARNRVVVQALK